MTSDAATQTGKLTFALVCLSTLGNFVAQGLLYPALPLYLTRELHTSKAVAGLVVSVLALTSIAVRPWAGGFIDRVGRRPLLIAGPILGTVSALGLLTLESVLAVLIMRLIQGAGSAMTYSSAVAAVADVAPPERRAGYLALFSTFFYVGFALGPFIAELLIESSGFAAVWWTVGSFTAFGAVVATFVRETKPVSTTAPPKVPMLHRLFHPAARLPGMVFFCTGIGWTAIASFLSLYARDIGLSNSDILFVALSISVLATRFISGGLADRFGRLAVVVPSIVLVTAGLTGLAVFDTPTAAVISLAVFGVGYSGGFPALLTMVVDRAPERERGVAMSSFNVFFDIGAPIGGYGVGQLIDWGGFPMGFGFSALAAGVGLLFLPAMRRPTTAGVAATT
ncbi:MAG: MFS transporter [Acidimicrobiales bacterium]|nr:MFS transporter [Acidimicrobiales bacterium]